jgi:uncharacterized protein YbcI
MSVPFATATRSSRSARAEPDGGRSSLIEISNGMVGLYKQATGRGPTKARTHFAGPDTLLIMLGDSLTAAEQTLLAMGESERVTETRLVLEQALEPAARSLVERVVGRRTIAFITGIDLRHAVTTMVLTLEASACAAERSTR